MRLAETIEIESLEKEITQTAIAALVDSAMKVSEGKNKESVTNFLCGEMCALDIICFRIGKILGHPFIIKVPLPVPGNEDWTLGEAKE